MPCVLAHIDAARPEDENQPSPVNSFGLNVAMFQQGCLGTHYPALPEEAIEEGFAVETGRAQDSSRSCHYPPKSRDYDNSQNAS